MAFFLSGYAKGETNEHFQNMAALCRRHRLAVVVGLRDGRRYRPQRKAAGVYRAVSFLRPHFQLDELSVSLRLVAELPQSTNY
jgi:hypothetical protein